MDPLAGGFFGVFAMGSVGSRGTWVALERGVETDRHRSIIDASERFATEARSAASDGNHVRAAALYWAAAMVLSGHSAREIEFLLAQFSSFRSALEGGILNRGNEPVARNPVED